MSLYDDMNRERAKMQQAYKEQQSGVKCLHCKEVIRVKVTMKGKPVCPACGKPL